MYCNSKTKITSGKNIYFEEQLRTKWRAFCGDHLIISESKQMKTTTMPNYIWHSFEYYSFMITSTLARRRLEFSDDSSVLLVFLAAFRPALFTDKFFAFFLPFFLEGRPLLSSSASSVYPLSSDSSEELGTFRWFLVDLIVVFWNDAKGLILRFSFPESSSSSPSSSETSVKQQAR